MTSTFESEKNPFKIRRRRSRWLIGAYVAAVAVLATATVVYVVQREPQCASGIPKVDVTARGEVRQECVGVTDSFAFEPRFQRIVDTLRKENDFATQGGPGTYVTVAFLGALTNPDERVVHQLEGAAVGQHRANQDQLVGDSPRIRLVLANMDSTEGQWQQVTDTLLTMVAAPDRLVAVAGLGLSQHQTLLAAQRLSTANLPMVGDIVTTDEIDKADANGLARVNPRVGDEVVALAKYLEDRTRLRSAMLVSYDKEDDLYARSLVTAFKRTTGTYWRAGGSVENPFGENPGNEFNIIVSNLCSVQAPDMIFYAGRALDLPKFIGYLSNRNCHPGEITVVTGSDAVRLILDGAENNAAAAALGSARNPISLIYSPLAEPAVLRDAARNPAKDQYDKFEASFRAVGFDPEHLRTGWAIVAHDAVLTDAKAIRLAAPAGGLPEPAKVRAALYLLSSPANSVPGASGQIQLDPGTGNRTRLQLPILRLRPGTDPDILGIYSPSAR
jgi:hypothetical protein